MIIIKINHLEIEVQLNHSNSNKFLFELHYRDENNVPKTEHKTIIVNNTP